MISSTTRHRCRNAGDQVGAGHGFDIILQIDTGEGGAVFGTTLRREDNIEAVPGTNLIPGIRFDYHNQFGSNWSPSLNLCAIPAFSVNISPSA
jgi:hypothetical protein